MAVKLHPPHATPVIGKDGRVTMEWVLFFEKLSKILRLTDVLEIGTGAIETNGNWRITQSGNDLVIQRLEAGTWTTKSTITAV
jgi:hypothetical protein